MSLDEHAKIPLEKWSGIEDNITPSDFHTWGCPVYILDAVNQEAIGTPKWEPRSHIGIYLGHSPCHAGTVALVLNLATGLVSPQYHVVFDDKFSTVPYLQSSTPPPNWISLLENNSEQVLEKQQTLSREWLDPTGSLKTNNIVSEGDDISISDNIVSEGANISQTTKPQPTTNEAPTILWDEDQTTQINVPNVSKSMREDKNENIPFVNIDTMGLRRGNRKIKGTRKLIESRHTDPNNKSLAFHAPLAMLILVLIAFTTPLIEIIQVGVQQGAT